MAETPDEVFTGFEERGEDEVRKLLANKSYREPTKSLAVEWLRRKDLEHEERKWAQRFEAESRERVNAQKFQAAQSERQMELAEKQLQIAGRAKNAAIASAAGIGIMALIRVFELFAK